MAERLSISRAWDESRGVFARDGKLVTSVALALILLPQAIAGLIAPPPTLSGQDPPSWMALLTLLVALLGIIGQIAIVRLALGPATSVSEAIARGFRRLLPAFLALLLFAIALTLLCLPVLLLLMSPDDLQAMAGGTPTAAAGSAVLAVLAIVILLGARFQLIMPVAAAEDVGAIGILKRSWNLSKGHYWRLLGFLLLVLLTAVIAVLFVGQIMGGAIAKLLFGDVQAFTVAALVAALLMAVAQAAFSALISVMLARIYVQLAGRDAAEATVPSSGT